MAFAARVLTLEARGETAAPSTSTGASAAKASVRSIIDEGSKERGLRALLQSRLQLQLERRGGWGKEKGQEPWRTRVGTGSHISGVPMCAATGPSPTTRQPTSTPRVTDDCNDNDCSY